MDNACLDFHILWLVVPANREPLFLWFWQKVSEKALIGLSWATFLPLNQSPGPEECTVLTDKAWVKRPLLELGKRAAPVEPIRVGRGVSQRKFQVLLPEGGELDAEGQKH